MTVKKSFHIFILFVLLSTHEFFTFLILLFIIFLGKLHEKSKLSKFCQNFTKKCKNIRGSELKKLYKERMRGIHAIFKLPVL